MHKSQLYIITRQGLNLQTAGATGKSYCQDKVQYITPCRSTTCCCYTCLMCEIVSFKKGPGRWILLFWDRARLADFPLFLCAKITMCWLYWCSYLNPGKKMNKTNPWNNLLKSPTAPEIFDLVVALDIKSKETWDTPSYPKSGAERSFYVLLAWDTRQYSTKERDKDSPDLPVKLW